MYDRWLHPPKLHSPGPTSERKVGWLELFYDLIYVAAIIQLGNALSAHPTPLGLLEFFLLFLPIWFTWTGFTFYSNRFVVDDVLHRGLVFLQMFGIGLMAIVLPGVFEGETRLYALSYALVRLVLVALYVRAWWQEERSRPLTGRYALGFALGVAVWFASAWVPTPWVYLVWAVAMGIDLAVPLSAKAREVTGRHPPDVLHMSERYGLLTIIVLGESFVKVLTAVSEQGGTVPMLLMAGLSLALTCSVWWIYFDDVAGSRIKRTRMAAYVWVYTHFPLTAAITALGVGIKKQVFFDPLLPAPEKYRWLLAATLGLVFLAVGIIDAVTQRRQAELSDTARVNMRIASAFLVLLLAPVGGAMPAWAFSGLLASACLVQVLFDLTMAPHAAGDDHHHEDAAAFPAAGADRSAPPPPSPTLRGSVKSVAIGQARRKGVPNEFRRDLYFHFMDGSWTRVFVYVVALFVLGNVVFGALYMLEPGGVAELAPDSFLEAFSFSVQTVATIGYGEMFPTSTWAHVLVAIQALFGLILVALVTGLVFAKASRPTGSVLFSEPMVVTTRHGQRFLQFRCGNARGNDLIEATVRVSALRSEVTPEGHRMRKLTDLALERTVTPVFTLSWTVMHPLEDGPLAHLDERNCDNELVAIIVTLTGHDGTYGQTVYDRKLYFPDDIRWHHRFVDVLSTAEDGVMEVDYNHFHDTLPDDEAEPRAAR